VELDSQQLELDSEQLEVGLELPEIDLRLLVIGRRLAWRLATSNNAVMTKGKVDLSPGSPAPANPMLHLMAALSTLAMVAAALVYLYDEVVLVDAFIQLR
jgi:hypothetical protein